ncbi:MAG: extensin family protein [Deltaproteobacteria bacterium]|nr:extensin family protein [Deltaproteobacteria bacterium]
MVRLSFILLVLVLPLTAAADGGSYFSFFNGWPHDHHSLDATPRFLEQGERMDRCPTDTLVHRRGEAFRYNVRVHPEFGERLERFEQVVVDLATTHYGRPPTRMVHGGTYNCRRARGRRGRISEHAFGNAIDLEGFDFGRLPRDAELPVGVHRRFRRPFRLRIGQHWGPRRQRDAHHAEFLHGLAEKLRRRPDIFRGIVGPPRPRHHNHLHLDASPWRYAMFSYEDPTE